MTVEVAAAKHQAFGGRLRSLSKVSMRSALIAGVTSVGIVSAFPDGTTAARTELPAAVAAVASTAIEVTQRDVQLMAYIPGWSDAWSLVNNVFYDLEPFITTVVNTAVTVASYIPVVNIIADQVYFIYHYALWPIVWYPLTCGTAFLASFDPYYIGHIFDGIVTSWSYFVQTEINYFLNGGWIPFAAAATPAAAKVGGGADATDADGPKPVGTSTGRSGRLAHIMAAPEAPGDSAIDSPVASALPAEPVPTTQAQVSEATEAVPQTDASATEAGAADDATEPADDGSATPPVKADAGGTGSSAKAATPGKKKSANSSAGAGADHSKAHGSSGRAKAHD